MLSLHTINRRKQVLSWTLLVFLPVTRNKTLNHTPLGFTDGLAQSTERAQDNWVALPVILLTKEWHKKYKHRTDKCKVPNKEERLQGRKNKWSIWTVHIYSTCKLTSGNSNKWIKYQASMESGHKNGCSCKNMETYILLLANICPQYALQFSYIILTGAQ